MADRRDIYELDQLANQPGTYFNPHTEVVVVVDDSTAVDQDVFDSDVYQGSEWVRISDEIPLDETALEEALENFQSAFHPTGETVSAAALDPDEEEFDPDADKLEPDPEEDD
jgi:hypothetical protein